MVLLRKCLESHHSSKLSDELPCEGERRAKIDSARRFVETWGKGFLPSPRATGSPPQVLRGRRSCLRRTKGLLRHAFSECEIWAYKVPKRSAGTKDRPLDRSTPHSFQRNGSSRKCLESHHSFKNLVMSFPVKGSEELRLTRPEIFVETWGKWTPYRRQGRQGVLPQVLRGRRSCLRRTKGLLRHAFSECEIWAYKVPEA